MSDAVALQDRIRARGQARRYRAETKLLLQQEQEREQTAIREKNVKRAINAWSYAVAHYRYSRKLRNQHGAHDVRALQTVWAILSVVLVGLSMWFRDRSGLSICVAVCVFTCALHTKTFRRLVTRLLGEPDQCRRHRQVAHAYKSACGQALRLMMGRTTSERRYHGAHKNIAWLHRFLDPVNDASWDKCFARGQQEAQLRIVGQ